jgi:hypothetical protein
MICQVGIIILLVVFGFIFRFNTIKIGENVLIIDRFLGKARIVEANGLSISVTDKGAIKGPAFQAISIPNINTKIEANIKWRDGKIYYQLKTDSFNEKVSKIYSNRLAVFTLSLEDEDGFVVKDIRLPISSFTRTVDNNDKPIEISISGSEPFSMSDFSAIKRWNILWSGF